MNHRRTLRFGPVLLAGLLGAAACTDAVQTTGPDDDRTPATNLSTDDIILTSGLQTLDTCDALLNRIKDEAVERVGPYGFDQGNYFLRDGEDFAVDDASDEESAGGDLTSADTPTAAPATTTSDAAEGALDRSGEFSETNNQEQDVDEADLVKTDGDRMIIVSGSTLRVIDLTGSTPTLAKTIQLPEETYGGQLFLSGDRALLMTSGWTERPFLETSITSDWYPGSSIGRLVEINLDEGRVERTLEFEGGYLSAREIGGTIRIVLTASANRFAFVYPSNEGAADSAEKANRGLIEESTIEQWIPTYRITENGGTVTEGPIVDCNRVHLPADFAGFGSLIMLTADIENGLEINDALSVFTDAQTVYASTDRVAVATPRWPVYNEDGEPDDDEFSTAIHTFDITDAARADYVSSGSVRGHLLNQFSISEYDGYLRVATTDGSPWWGRNDSESFVTVLAEDDGALKQVGQVGGLGRGEQIFAVRFLGTLGYVVTFEQIDPLYTIDLSDPASPEVVGELKIPGFSSYLHPLDQDHLLGIGTDGDESGRTSGAVVSLFDVSDLANPTRTAKLNLGRTTDGTEGDSYSPVSDDAKAFTYWDGVAVVPVSWWDYNPTTSTEQNGSEAVLVDVDVNGNLTEIGRISHPATRECEDGIIYEEEPQEAPPVTTEDGGDAEASFVDEPTTTTIATAPTPLDAPEQYCYTWAPQIQRSVIVDDNIFTISEAGVQVNDFETLGDVTWIRFER